MRISQLEGQRVAIWGWGRESRAAHAVLRSRLPKQLLTVLCAAGEVDAVNALADPLLQISTQTNGDVLASFDVVIKSPGISPYRPEVDHAIASGTRFVGGTELWFAEHPDARTVCITGTKGKSTTSALIAHLLRAGGHRVALAGNIGMPLLELLDQPQTTQLQSEVIWVIELSSYQTRDVAASGSRPSVAVGLNVYPEHLDWHGSHEQYVADKLALFTVANPRVAVLNALDPTLAALELPDWQAQQFNVEHGWHLRDGFVYHNSKRVLDASAVPLPGRHNLWNLCAALAAIDALGIDAHALAGHARDFAPLPHRLQPLGERSGIDYINDSISTTPHASIAALNCHADETVAILVGGFDRGVDWTPFVDHLRERPVHAVITMGQNGPRIHAALRPLADAGLLQVHSATSMADAMTRAGAALPDGGTILLSPGAPSFGAYADYAERGRDFAACAGFDPDAISHIHGLGIS